MRGGGHLNYSVRVRDLVHGFVYLTELENKIIDHPLFQRLRHIRQNDVASYVYPSLNTTRFEHSLGVAHVVGRMAENLLKGAVWNQYKEAIENDVGAEIKEEDFLQVCRVYGLLHDVGHFPLSHLFEIAFKDYAAAVYPQKALSELIKEWFPEAEGFTKLHEAAGAAITKKILNDIQKQDGISNIVKDTVEKLMSSKNIASKDVCFKREKSNTMLLWKNRVDYQEYHQDLSRKLNSRADTLNLYPQKFGRAFEKSLSKKIGHKSVVFWLPFQPLEREKIRLTDEIGKNEMKDDAVETSPILSSLQRIWDAEPHYYIIVFTSSLLDKNTVKESWLSAAKECLD
jgi:hypothetical protein